MSQPPPILAETVLSDRTILNRVNTATGVPELVIRCTPCRHLGHKVEFALPEGSSTEVSTGWADEVDQHYRKAHR